MKRIEIGHSHNSGDIKRTMIHRIEDVGISGCKFSAGSSVWYEVYKIKKNRAYQAFGREFEASESVPCDSSWGSGAKTCKTIERALEIAEKFKNEMKEQEIAR